MGKKAKQEIHIGPLPKGAAPQEIYVNPSGGQQPEASPAPHYAAGTVHLITALAVAAFLVVIACGVASALTAGAIW